MCAYRKKCARYHWSEVWWFILRFWLWHQARVPQRTPVKPFFISIDMKWVQKIFSPRNPSVEGAKLLPKFKHRSSPAPLIVLSFTMKWQLFDCSFALLWQRRRGWESFFQRFQRTFEALGEKETIAKFIPFRNSLSSSLWRSCRYENRRKKFRNDKGFHCMEIFQRLFLSCLNDNHEME